MESKFLKSILFSDVRQFRGYAVKNKLENNL